MSDPLDGRLPALEPSDEGVPILLPDSSPSPSPDDLLTTAAVRSLIAILCVVNGCWSFDPSSPFVFTYLLRHSHTRTVEAQILPCWTYAYGLSLSAVFVWSWLRRRSIGRSDRVGTHRSHGAPVALILLGLVAQCASVLLLFLSSSTLWDILSEVSSGIGFSLLAVCQGLEFDVLAVRGGYLLQRHFPRMLAQCQASYLGCSIASALLGQFLLSTGSLSLDGILLLGLVVRGAGLVVAGVLLCIRFPATAALLSSGPSPGMDPSATKTCASESGSAAAFAAPISAQEQEEHGHALLVHSVNGVDTDKRPSTPPSAARTSSYRTRLRWGEMRIRADFVSWFALLSFLTACHVWVLCFWQALCSDLLSGGDKFSMNGLITSVAFSAASFAAWAGRFLRGSIVESRRRSVTCVGLLAVLVAVFVAALSAVSSLALFTLCFTLYHSIFEFCNAFGRLILSQIHRMCKTSRTKSAPMISSLTPLFTLVMLIALLIQSLFQVLLGSSSWLPTHTNVAFNRPHPVDLNLADQFRVWAVIILVCSALWALAQLLLTWWPRDKNRRQPPP